MKVLFHRSSSLLVKVQKPEAHRAFVFDVQIGVSKSSPPVDALSGMVINLVRVDLFLAGLALLWPQREWSSLQELLKFSQEFLKSQTEIEGVTLEEVCLKEKRGFWLTWRPCGLRMGREIFREWEGGLCRLRMESSFDESRLEHQDLEINTPEDLESGRILEQNPSLQYLEIEKEGGGERWSWQNESSC